MKHKNNPFLTLLLLLLAISSCGGGKIKVDTIYHNGKITTMDDSMPEATVMVVDKGKIVDIGGNDLLTKYKCNDTAFIDLKGRQVYPGLIDAHCHYYGYSKSRLTCDLTGTKSWEEVLLKLDSYAKIHKEGWILGRGWDQNDWKGGVLEFSNQDLNKIFSDRPVFLKRVDGHAAICNSMALKLAGIDKDTKVEGGEIVMSDDNLLSGMLIDNAVDLVEKVVPNNDREALIATLQAAENECYSYGLTTLSDAGLDIAECLFLDSLHDKGALSIYLYMMLNPNSKNMEYAKNIGIYESDNTKICSFKLYADGALGSRGALLKQAYCDRPGHYGLKIRPYQYFDSFVNIVQKFTKYQVNTHCIGDSANKMILELYGKYLPQGNDMRWRIEHAQIVDPMDIQLFKVHGIIPSVQPTHAISDGPWVKDRICEHRMKGAYAYKSLLGSSEYIALGTDFPVEGINPMNTFFAAVFRESKSEDQKGTFMLDERLERLEALKGMTIWAAKSCFLDHRKGKLSKGYDADFIVMDTNLLEAGKEEIRKAQVIYTYRNGKRVFWRKD